MTFSNVFLSLQNQSAMSPDALAAIFGGIAVAVSWAGSAFISGVRWGTVKTRLDMVEQGMSQMATKEQMAGVKEDVAEIKGMFRMTLRDGSGDG